MNVVNYIDEQGIVCCKYSISTIRGECCELLTNRGLFAADIAYLQLRGKCCELLTNRVFFCKYSISTIQYEGNVVNY